MVHVGSGVSWRKELRAEGRGGCVRCCKTEGAGNADSVLNFAGACSLVVAALSLWNTETVRMA